MLYHNKKQSQKLLLSSALTDENIFCANPYLIWDSDKIMQYLEGDTKIVEAQYFKTN